MPANPVNSFWNEDRVAILIKCVRDGLSAGAAGSVLGITRNAATGKANRMGFKFHSVQPSGQPRKRNRPARPQFLKFEPIQQDLPASDILLEQFDANIPVEQRKTLFELGAWDCRFIVGDPKEPDSFYCGGTCKEGEHWCGFHRRIVYRQSMPNLRSY